MKNTDKAARAVEVLKLLMSRHIEMFEGKKDLPDVVIQRDECSFLWIPLLKYAMKNVAHAVVIRHEEEPRALELEIAKLITEFIRRELLRDTVNEELVKYLLESKMKDLEIQIKQEDEPAYAYITGKIEKYE